MRVEVAVNDKSAGVPGRRAGRGTGGKGRVAGATLTALGLALGATIVAGGPAQAAVPAAVTPAAVTPAAVTPAVAAAPTDAQINASLAALAKVFAAAAANAEFRGVVHDAVGKRFDGDVDVLWKTLASNPKVKSTLAAAAAKQLGLTAVQAQTAVESFAALIPRFQVAVPANFDKWNAATYTPLVAFMPSGVEDTTLKTMTAYDATGAATQLDAQVAPSTPVIVLSLNERTDDAGNLVPVTTVPPPSAPEARAAAASSYQVNMKGIDLIKDKEAWGLGAAEISLRAKSANCSGVGFFEPDWDGLEHDGDQWRGTKYLGSSKCDVIFSWWEEDSLNFDFKLKYKDVDLGVNMSNADDIIGDIQMPHAKFQGTTQDQASWSALKQSTD